MLRQFKNIFKYSSKIKLNNDIMQNATPIRDPSKTYTLVMLRHGNSQWNQENRFTGWVDVPLTEKGINEAKKAGQLLNEKGFKFDVAYTSVLQRAIHTLDNVLTETGQIHLPVHKLWRLNERHYGGLTGKNKKEMAEEVGAEQVHIWRRSHNVAPPALAKDSEYHPLNDPKYALLPPDALPDTEHLMMCAARVLPAWYDQIAPEIYSGKQVIIAAHGNSCRSLIMHLEDLSGEEIVGVELPTGTPIVYTLDHNLKCIKKEILELPADE